MKSKSFLIYKHLKPIVDQLDNEQSGRLFKHIYQHETIEDYDVRDFEDDGEVVLAFTMFKIHLDKADEDYKKKCEVNRANASKRKRSVSSGNNININKNKLL